MHSATPRSFPRSSAYLAGEHARTSHHPDWSFNPFAAVRSAFTLKRPALRVAIRQTRNAKGHFVSRAQARAMRRAARVNPSQPVNRNRTAAALKAWATIRAKRAAAQSTAAATA